MRSKEEGRGVDPADPFGRFSSTVRVLLELFLGGFCGQQKRPVYEEEKRKTAGGERVVIREFGEEGGDEGCGLPPSRLALRGRVGPALGCLPIVWCHDST